MCQAPALWRVTGKCNKASLIRRPLLSYFVNPNKLNFSSGLYGIPRDDIPWWYRRNSGTVNSIPIYRYRSFKAPCPQQDLNLNKKAEIKRARKSRQLMITVTNIIWRRSAVEASTNPVTHITIHVYHWRFLHWSEISRFHVDQTDQT